MMLDRAAIIDQNFLQRVKTQNLPTAACGISPSDTKLSSEEYIDLFTSQIISRHLDLQARILKDQGLGFYTIGSSGHEGNAAFGKIFRHTDMAFLHYRCGAFMVQRSKHLPDINPIRDQMLSLVAAKDDPISQGRHKVFGSRPLWVPPQTSTIASHLPKAMGAGFAATIAKQLNIETELPKDFITLCTFGDASYNHATAQSAINTLDYLSYQGLPLKVVFICEDNGIGISVKTPKQWIENRMPQRHGLKYISCNGLHLPDVILAAEEAEHTARQQQKPVFLHMKCIRLGGHAGSDTEIQYNSMKEIEANESQDPLLHSARIMLENHFMEVDDILTLYENIRKNVEQEAERAIKLPKLSSAQEVMQSIAPTHKPLANPAGVLDEEQRKSLFGKQFKYLTQPRSLCQNINFALTDLMHKYPKIITFGEDVAKKGGVYRVTADLQSRFGKRVFDTLLDETSILGTAIGAAHLGLLPIPEIQFLAYTHNAEDQLRGEAATLSFFSNAQFSNPMIIRIAGLAYQKGFGGHFHNDNSIAFLRDIPGVIIACPAHGEDAAKMLATCAQLAFEQKRIIIFLEPIALYHTKDLHEKGDNAWLNVYPGVEQNLVFGEPGFYGKGKDLLIVTYGNGYYLSRQAENILKEQHQANITIMDLRWLAPLNKKALLEAANKFDKVLIVDECRKTGSLSEEIITTLVEHCDSLPKVKRITGDDTFIPIGESWQFVLPSKEDIVSSALELLK